MCILCSTESKGSSDRYNIFNLSGNNGAALDDVERFLDVKFARVKDNFGAFICRTCRRDVQKHKIYLDKASSVYDSLHQKSQQLDYFLSFKRGKRTSPQKSVTPQKGQMTPRMKFPSTKTLSPISKQPAQIVAKPRKKLCYGPDNACSLPSTKKDVIQLISPIPKVQIQAPASLSDISYDF